MKLKNYRSSLISIAVCLSSTAAGWSTTYTASNGFEADAGGWTATSRSSSGTGGITSESGGFHGIAASGAFTRWGGYQSIFPSGGYTTSVDVYLNLASGSANDTRFCFSSAVNGTTGSHRRDFVFNGGFYNDSDVTGSAPRFVFSASNGAGRSNAYPKNPARSPIAITNSGWYTFEHTFEDNAGVLSVTLRIKDASNQLVGSWSLSDPSDIIGTTVGGNRYGWFALNEFTGGLAIDNSSISSSVQPSVTNVTQSTYHLAISSAVGEANPGDIIELGSQTFTESALTIGKALTLRGPNSGVSGSGTRMAEARLSDMPLTVLAPGVVLDGLEIYQTNNAPDAILIQADATVENSIIRRNGTLAGQTSRGITTAVGLGGVTISGNLFTGDPSGGFFSGHKSWNSGIYSNGGSATISGNTFENCRTAMNLDDFNVGMDVTGNQFRNSGTYLSFGGVTPADGSYSLTGNDFDINLGSPGLPSAFFNNSNVAATFRIDATSSTFGGVATTALTSADKFAIEARVLHRGRSNRNGVIDYVSGQQIEVAGTTLQSAIDAANSGDVVLVAPGTYRENLTVPKAVSIQGPNAGVSGIGVRGAEAIVQPAISAIDSGEIFHVTASDVTIDGLTIDGDNPTLTSGYLGTNGADQDAAEGVTVYVDNVNNLNVSNNVIRNLSYFGVTIFGATYSAPASSGHVVSNNLIENLGTYDAGSGIAKWGGGVLLYNSQYARVEDNVMQDVRLGVQTGNFHNANPGTAASQVITGNSIEARRLGIFHNLHTVLSSPITLSDNSITALGHPQETLVKGILLASLATPSFSQDNLIDLSAATTPSIGYEVWNVKSTSPASISGGSVTAATQGLFLNNFEGYNSNANDGAHASVSGLAISPTASGTGIRVLDSPASTTHAPVQLALGPGVMVSGGTNGLVIEGANASQTTIADLALSGQSGNYIQLISNAGNVDATSATFEGKLGSAMNLGELFAVEAKVVHQYDNPALGLVTWDAGFNPAIIVISDTQVAGDLTIPAGTTVTVTPTGSLTTDKLELEDGAELIVNEGDLSIGEDTVISGTFTIFNSFGSWNINGNTTFNIGQSLALVSDVHVAAGKTLTINGGGELILDGCVIDSQTPGSPYTITTAANGVLTMARNVVSDAIIDINTLTGSVPTNVVSRVYDNSFATSDIEAMADAKVYHNLFDAATDASSNTDATVAFAAVDGWGNITDASNLQNKLTLDFDAPLDATRTLDTDGNLFVQSLDPVAMRVDVSALGSNGITAAEALLGYNSNMLTLTGSPTVVDPEGMWEVIAENTSLTPPSTLGMVDSALGLQLTSGQPGSSANETIARVDFTAGNAGQTLGFFRVQSDRVFDGNGILIKDTRLTKSVSGLPSYLAAFTANTGELVIDNEDPEILAAPITGTQVQPSQVAPVNVLNTTNPVFRTSEPLVLTFSATDNGHGLSGIDALDTANDLVLYDVNSNTVINPAGYTVSTADVGGVVTYVVLLDVPAATPAGVYPVAATVQDRSGNVSPQTTLGSFIIANEAQVNVQLQGFTGTTRDVTFVATGGTPATWTKTITNFVGGSGFAILENVPPGTTSISAKSAWTLRGKVAASFTPAGVGTANLTGLNLLKAGDITGDNVINTLDYSVLRFNWLTTAPVSDIDGSGGTNVQDYNLLKANFYTAGSAQ